jgi:hypothetical protein
LVGAAHRQIVLAVEQEEGVERASGDPDRSHAEGEAGELEAEGQDAGVLEPDPLAAAGEEEGAEHADESSGRQQDGDDGLAQTLLLGVTFIKKRKMMCLEHSKGCV